MDRIDPALRKSSILTHHSTIIKQHTSLPSLHPSVEYMPAVKRPSIRTVFAIKHRSQIIRDERVSNLLKLKVGLEKQYKEHKQMQLCQAVEDQPEREIDFVQNLDNKLSKLMHQDENQAERNPEEEKDPDQEEFIKYCKSIADIYALGEREKNMRFTNKVKQMVSIMTHFTLLNQLCHLLDTPAPKWDELYKKFSRPFLNELTFYKQLKILYLRCSYMIENHEKNKYRHLNDDINRVRQAMNNDSKKVGLKLSHIDNYTLRQGIYNTLQKIDLGCLANKFIYCEYTDRLKKQH